MGFQENLWSQKFILLAANGLIDCHKSSTGTIVKVYWGPLPYTITHFCQHPRGDHDPLPMQWSCESSSDAVRGQLFSSINQ